MLKLSAVFASVGFQQDSLQSSAGELHPDFASWNSSPSAGLWPESHSHRVTSDRTLGPRASSHTSDFLRAARRTGEEKMLYPFKQLKLEKIVLVLCSSVITALLSRTVKSCWRSPERILPPYLCPSSRGCRSCLAPPGCSFTSTVGGLSLKLPNPTR